jgi:hypothetical protein
MTRKRLDDDRIKTHVGYRMMLENYKLLVADKSRQKSFEARLGTKNLLHKMSDYQSKYLSRMQIRDPKDYLMGCNPEIIEIND